MKRILAILLTLTICIGFCACSTATTRNVDKNTSENYIGVWETADRRLTLNPGGVGRYEQPNSDLYGYFDFTWEIKDNVLVITIPLTSSIATLELDDNGTCLTMIQDGLPGHTTAETVYIKQ